MHGQIQCRAFCTLMLSCYCWNGDFPQEVYRTDGTILYNNQPCKHDLFRALLCIQSPLQRGGGEVQFCHD